MRGGGGEGWCGGVGGGVVVVVVWVSNTKKSYVLALNKGIRQ